MTQADPASLDTIASEREAVGAQGPRIGATVLGMHRSGTSATARILSLLGGDLPRHLMSSRADNPSGHWESEPIAKLNDELLATASSSWDDISPFPRSWYGSAQEAEFRVRAVSALADEYGQSRLFVLKDPRISRIVPFWVSALDQFRATPAFVLTVRNPLEVAVSLRERNEFTIPKGLLLWLRHTLDAERDTRGHPRVFVSYERLLEDWESQARAISEQLQISWPRLSHESRDQVDRFLSPKLRHARYSADDLQTHASVVDWVTRAYAAVRAACETHEAPDPEVLAAVADEVRRADKAYGPILATIGGIARRRAAEIERRGQQIDELALERDDLREALDELGVEFDAIRGHEQELLGEIGPLRAEAERLAAEIAARRVRGRLAQQELIRRDRLIHAQRKELARLERRTVGPRSLLARREAEASRLREELGANRRQAESLRGRLEEREREQRKATELEARLAEAVAREQEQSEKAAIREELLAERAREAGELRAKLSAADAKRDRGRLELTRQRDELDRRREAIATGEHEMARLRAQADQSERRLADRQSEAARLEGELRELHAREARLRAELEARAAALAERELEATRLAAELAAGAEQLESAGRQIAAIEDGFTKLAGDVQQLGERSAAIRDQAALTYLEARVPGRLRTALTVWGWTVRPSRFAAARAARAIRSSGRFDERFYLIRYPDAATSGRDPIVHYVERGAAEGKDPNPTFHTADYLARHPELAGARQNPFAHFLDNLPDDGDSTSEAGGG